MSVPGPSLRPSRMRILSLQSTPLHEWSYLSAAPRGGSEARQLPLLSATVDTLPSELEALIALSDLQGVAPSALDEGAAVLLGEVLADELAMLAEVGELPHPQHVGILLAGDLFSESSGSVRGASGDVRSVWLAFAERFRWVAGVAGNDDNFGTARERELVYVAVDASTTHLFETGLHVHVGLALRSGCTPAEDSYSSQASGQNGSRYS